MQNDNGKASQEIFDHLKSQGIEIAEAEIKRITQKAQEIANYEPKVGVLGKTGVGKSSLCNALFGADVAEVNDVESCTREPGEYLVSLASAKGITLVDVPGVGENKQKDEEYAALYRSLLPELDVVLWLVQADTRDYAVDEAFYQEVFKPNLGDIPFIVAVNKVEKIEPFREWDEETNEPGPTQSENIQRKRIAVQRVFDIPRLNVVAVSARERYGLVKLIGRVITELPDEKKLGTFRRVRKREQTKEVEQKAKEGFWRSVKRVVGEFLSKHGDKVIGAVTTIFVALINRDRR